jgi:(5-formylfuran-3-yl)methyl phosphate synthase
MTLMLASVTNRKEAELAVREGADIIDLKDVGAGFGTVAPDAVRSVVGAVAHRRPVSAVAGESSANPERIAAIVSALAEAGASYVKVALSPGLRRSDCVEALAPLTRKTKIIGVMFADDGADNALIPLMAQSGFTGVMLDTARKTGLRLLDHIDITSLALFVEAAHAHGLIAGLAGSLETPDIPRLLLLAPDVLGFRRALCGDHDRNAQIDPGAVATVRSLIPADSLKLHHAGEAAPKVDYRVLAARGYSIDSNKGEPATDRIFVRDFDLPVSIGAYLHERVRPQNVRFNIEASIYRAEHVAEDMRDVFSYDLITDSIRMVVAQEHIALVETLAERIAALILTYPRVASITVRIEKLDVGPGAVGVEIVRERPAEVAKVHHLYPAAGLGNPKAAT